MMMLKTTAVFIVAITGISACTPQRSNTRQNIDPQTPVSAPARIQDALIPASSLSSLSTLGPGKQDQVVIKKSALEKEFLFSGSIIPQTGDATSHGLTGRIIAFREVGQRVFMLEATQGHVVSPTLPSTLILASFPILQENDDLLVLDFNQGMSQAFLDGGWQTSHSSDQSYYGTYSANKLQRSYLSSVRVVGNALEIRQLAQMPVGPSYNTYEFRYYLEPYHPNPSYSPLEADDSKHMGFFEVNPLLESGSGREVAWLTRRDISRPVVYAISSNTPPEFHNAVRDGILYWNQVFGRDVIQVINAPAGVTAPDPQYNIVQWVENNSAGFAYADALMDPRSGEILHSQVYLTSGFGINSKLEMPQLLRKIQTPQKLELETGVFATQRLCEYSASPEIASTLAQLRDQGAGDPALYLKSAQYYVQASVAHEIGHTLGLRHNFAGSLASTANPDEVDRMFVEFLMHGTVPPQGQYFSSSVMEYSVFAEQVLHAAMFNARKLVLPYDQAVIQRGYFGQAMDDKNAPLFCTDEQVGKLEDCQAFDRGPKPIVSNAMSILKTLKVLPAGLTELYIEAKAPADPRDRKDFAHVALDPDVIVKGLVDTLKSQIKWMKKGGVQSIAALSLFPFSTAFYKDDIESEQDRSVAAQVAEAGGIEAVLMPLIMPKLNPPLDTATKEIQGLASYLARDDVRNGTGWDEKPYALTDQEIALIESHGEKLFQEVEDQAFDQALDALGEGIYSNPRLAPEAEQMLEKIAATMILGITDQVVEGSPVTSATPPPNTASAKAGSSAPAKNLRKPALFFFFKKDERLKAVQLLKRSLGPSVDWSMLGRTWISTNLEAYLGAVLGKNPEKTDLSTLKPPMRQWLLDQRDILIAINQASER